MGDSSSYHIEIGVKAAKKAARFPGLGQLSNGETFKGTVQLSGFVISDAARIQAVHVTRGIEGVTGVKNDMRIK